MPNVGFLTAAMRTFDPLLPIELPERQGQLGVSIFVADAFWVADAFLAAVMVLPVSHPGWFVGVR